MRRAKTVNKEEEVVEQFTRGKAEETVEGSSQDEEGREPQKMGKGTSNKDKNWEDAMKKECS